MPPNTPPDPHGQPLNNEPQIVSSSMSNVHAPLQILSQLVHKPLVWAATGAVGIAMIGGVTFYTVSHHKQASQETVADQPAANKQTGTNGSSNQSKSETPAPSNPSSTPNPSSPTTPTKQTTSGGSTGSSGSSGGSSGNTGGSGGGTTPTGPIALKIMPLGDSITQGGVGDPQTVNGYRLQLWNNLGSAYQINYVGSWQNGNSLLADKDLNGFSGECIKATPCHGDPSLYSQTAAWITAEDPNLVIMQGGGNDFSDPSMTETLVETYMEDWISLVYATKPSVKIIVTGPPQWYPNYATALQNYVNQLKAAGKPIRFVPYDGLVDTVDGTHPSLAGYVAWGDALATKVRELYP
jgi:lysophospholipase L1-like esterase